MRREGEIAESRFEPSLPPLGSCPTTPNSQLCARSFGTVDRTGGGQNRVPLASEANPDSAADSIVPAGSALFLPYLLEQSSVQPWQNLHSAHPLALAQGELLD